MLIKYYNFRELSSTFARLCQLADETTSEMDNDMQKIASTLNVLEVSNVNTKVLKNKAHYLINELDLFNSAYLISLL
jgi:hypothetical protein